MYLTPHFHLDEFVASQTAARLGLDNTPDAKAIANLKRLALLLEIVRVRLGNPILISSGYRSPAVNTAVGGSKTSQHMTGQAVDFICPGFGKPVTIVSALMDCRDIEFDQLINEGDKWVHLSWASPARRQVLTARFGPGGVEYLPGVV